MVAEKYPHKFPAQAKPETRVERKLQEKREAMEVEKKVKEIPFKRDSTLLLNLLKAVHFKE